MDKYDVIIEKPVLKFLQSHSDITKRFFDKVKIIENDFKSELLDIKKLVGNVNAYRLRIGKYRFLFRIDKKVVVVYFYDVDSRGGIYK